MKKTLLTSFILLTIATCAIGQSCKRYYKKQIDQKSKMVDCGANYTVEHTRNGNFVYKVYFPATKFVTKFVTYKSERLLVKNGLYQEFWDDGTLITSGEYINNKKQGHWVEEQSHKGQYVDDRKQGKWLTYNSDSTIWRILNYSSNILHGEQSYRDSLGAVYRTEVYEMGKLIQTRGDSIYNSNEKMPIFSGCEDSTMTYNQVLDCSRTNMLNYLFNNFHYPYNDKRRNIQGKAVVKFVINSEGKVERIKVLSGITNSIRKEVISVVENMPRWKPGIQNGKPVNVEYTLPIELKVE